MDQFLTDLFINAQSLSKTLMFQKLVPVNFLLTVHVHAVMWKCITTTGMYVFRVGPEERLWKRTVRHVHWTRKMLWMVDGRWRKLIQDVWWSGWLLVGERFFWYRSSRVVLDKRSLNGCVCVCVRACVLACVRACVRACMCVLFCLTINFIYDVVHVTVIFVLSRCTFTWITWR